MADAKEIKEAGLRIRIRLKAYDHKVIDQSAKQIIDKIKNDTFSLKEIYIFETYLKTKYPNNNHIKDKIRQQLQILRDKGIIEFSGRGSYKKL